MYLTDQEKSDLRSTIETLVEFDEPEALLGSLRRAAQRKAEIADRRIYGDLEAKRWRNLADALSQAELTIEHANAPKAKAPEEKNRQGNPPQQSHNAYLAQKAATEQAV